MQQFFSILGGMGTMATDSFIRILNQRTPAKNDQDYLNYILVNHATVPDRTTYLLDHSKTNFLPTLLEDVEQQNSLKPDFMVMVCNTAHYFYDELNAASDVPFLNMPEETVKEIKHKFPTAKRIGLAATQGTVASGVYQPIIKKAGYTEVDPTPAIQQKINDLIYTSIKEEQGHVDATLYHTILADMVQDMKVDAIILGCTELSLAEEKAPDHNYPVVDSQSTIADRTLELALKLRQERQAK
ncbi:MULTISPECIES: amino acid racemase [Loigolactobacillus]|uniref:Aspartate racemase n=1 Tax=Loigolactobacillus backii TaxID=375175 RepID=A0A192GZP8_9LACO|nr:MULTISPECIES: amino acid racemase [Loigolactobacillus]ANK58868.1 aspartate racemase [Loigolactobacillus backii]ANK61467.1 aspartate racemase [Loigolactobacillus backii]ANK63858.1 aspartate racemase [Loigolactobacillus backii]ANK66306.1 aspartate racemase [Loigolactobacillus backii]ANK69334.1 aspartate racemase [Loigolactobacillus backii]